MIAELYGKPDYVSSVDYASAEVLANKGPYGLRDIPVGGIVEAPVTIGDNITRLRTAAGYKKPADFARAMGVPQARVSDWESNRYDAPDLDTLIVIAKFLKCSIDSLIEGRDAGYDEQRRADLLRHTEEIMLSGKLTTTQRQGTLHALTRSLEDRDAALKQLAVYRDFIRGAVDLERNQRPAVREDSPTPKPPPRHRGGDRKSR